MSLVQPDNMTSHIRASDGVNSPQALQIRLDTSEILMQIENFLNGVAYSQDYDEEKKEFVPIKKNYGTTLANDEGIRNIMFFVSSLFNRALVLGNIIDHKAHQQMIGEIYDNFNDTLFLNLKKWEIDEEKADMVVYTIMHMIELFLTRPIGDGERGTLNSSESRETVRTMPQEKRPGILGLRREYE